MTTYVTAAMVAPVATKAQVEAAIALLTPTYTVGLTTGVVPIAPTPAWDTPPTHYYGNAASIDVDLVTVWQSAAGGSLPEGFELPPEATMTEQHILDAMAGIPIWSGVNVTNAPAWALANLAPEGLRLPPPNPNE